MTPRQLYRSYQILADAAASAHLSAPRFAKLYWLCQIEYLLELSRQPVSELVNRASSPFKRVYIGAGRIVLLANIDPVPLVIRAVVADFANERDQMPVSPLDSDTEATAQLDPFRRASDDDPKYKEDTDRFLTILSDSIPDLVRILYWCYPEPLDLENDTEPMENEVSQWAILRRVIAEKDLIDEKYNRYMLLANRVIPTAEKPT